MLNIASICSPTSFLIAGCREWINAMIFYRHSLIHGRGVGLLTSTVEASLTKQDSYFATVF